MSSQETQIPYRSIVPIFQEKDIWDQLRDPGNIRYDRYRTTETPQEFARLLGDDVRFVSHPGVTYNISKRFIESQNNHRSNGGISEEEASILLTASLIHDWGELKIDGRGHGDVTFEQHTLAYEQEEGTIFERIIKRMGHKGDREYISKAYQIIVEDRSSKLGRMFNAIERIGYLNTGLRAYTGRHGLRIGNWHGLVGNVFSNQIIPLLGYQNDYSLVQETLRSNLPLICSAFDEISLLDNLTARDNLPSYKLDKFNQAKEAWGKAVFATE